MKLKKTVSVFGMMLLLLVGSLLPAWGQRTVKTDPAFNAFWIKFKAAVARNNKAGVADMTKLPFLMGGEDLDRAGFLKQYSSLFTPKIRRCFARAKPTRDQDAMEIFCGDQIFLFAKVDGVYKFTEIGVND